MKFITLLIIFVILIAADKLLTVANVYQVNKNFPETKTTPYQIEKNPINRWIFNKFGLIKGTIIYFFFSVFFVFIPYHLFKIVFKSESIALYIIMIAFGFVITNNTYFLLKYSRLIP